MLEFRFCVQDPTDPDTEYLYEAIVAEAVNASAWQGMYAFASRGGVDQLIEDPVVQEFLNRGGEIDLIVGIDAVTNRLTLERLVELGKRYDKFRPRVFWNDSSGLFHPKVSYFTFDDGHQTVIVGSGNLTPGGMTHNFEAYCIATAVGKAKLDVSAFDDFLARQVSNIRDIDDAALERAALNVTKPIKAVKTKVALTPLAKKPTLPVKLKAAEAKPVFDRFLVAQIPKAGDRWAQGHFNAEVVKQFFRVSNLETQRVFLTPVDVGGTRGTETVRPVIYSETNKNYKIELRAAKGLEYPEDSPPVAVFRERKVRTFDYMLLMPDCAGYEPMLKLTQTLQKVGRGLPRVITDAAIVEKAWNACPLLAPEPETEKDL
ncbi:MAG: phospholipase D family protein [Burkholderiales bacterium]